MKVFMNPDPQLLSSKEESEKNVEEERILENQKEKDTGHCEGRRKENSRLPLADREQEGRKR